jgi:type IV secretory pathway TrbD component
MSGTVHSVNKALIRPVLIAGVEKKLFVANAVLCFPLVAATHFHFPACLFGCILFVINHLLLVSLAKHDPILGEVFKRYTRYQWQGLYLPRSHPTVLTKFPISSVPKV